MTRKPSPLPSASIWSLLTFSWLNELIETGYKRTLQDEDIFDLHEDDRVSKLSEQFETAWTNERSTNPSKPSLGMKRYESNVLETLSLSDYAISCCVPFLSYLLNRLLFRTCHEAVKAFRIAFGSLWYTAGVYKLIHDLSVFIPSLIINEVSKQRSSRLFNVMVVCSC